MTAVSLDTDPALATPAATEQRWCDWHGCRRHATHAVRFHDQAGHVHDCDIHTHDLREFCDVAEAVPLPCPFSHENGETWVDVPRELDVDGDGSEL